MFLLRHGQSYFNLHYTETKRDPGIADPELTPLGHQQARLAAERLRDAGLTRVIVSPYVRALQTAQPFLDLPGVSVEVMPQVRERTAFTCDIGTHPDILARRFPQHEFGHLPPRWWHEGEEEEALVRARADEFRTIMAARADHATTLLVSHWGFILALTGVSLMNGEMIAYDPRVEAPGALTWGP
jgi:broad specificity phosphatase PhoE